jgi:integrase
MPKMKLTKRVVDAVEVRPKNYIIFDQELPCFGLRVMPSGKRFFLVQYKFKGRTRRVMLGMYGPVTPEEARRRATVLLGEVKAGIDPAERRDAERSAPTMKAFGERFLKQHADVHCKPTTRAEYKRSVELFINPKFGTRRVTDITRADVAELHYEMRETPYQANRTLGVLSKMFSLADLWGVRTDGVNPCWKVPRYKEEKRERYLTKTELKTLGEVLRQSNSEPEAVAAIRLLLLTGCRLSEIQKLEWAHVDLDDCCLRLPDSKTGAKVVQLGPAALRVLRGITRIDGNPYVITGKKEGSHLTDLQRPWRRLRKRAGLEDVRIHDLRHSFASDALELGEDLPMIGKMLGHKDIKSTARYAHLKDKPVKAATAKVAESIDAALAGVDRSADEAKAA